MTEKTLSLIFLNASGNQVRMNVSNVKDGITDVEVKAAMETIIAKNIFSTDGGDLVSIYGAEIATRTVEQLSVK